MAMAHMWYHYCEVRGASVELATDKCAACGKVAIPPVEFDQASDLVNHPPHYTSHPSGVECITVTEHMNFNLGNAVKYIWRAGEKDSAKLIEDLRKAQWYLTREIERISK